MGPRPHHFLAPPPPLFALKRKIIKIKKKTDICWTERKSYEEFRYLHLCRPIKSSKYWIKYAKSRDRNKFIPFFDFQYEKFIFNCEPSHFSPCSALPGYTVTEALEMIFDDVMANGKESELQENWKISAKNRGK